MEILRYFFFQTDTKNSLFGKISEIWRAVRLDGLEKKDLFSGNYKNFLGKVVGDLFDWVAQVSP